MNKDYKIMIKEDYVSFETAKLLKEKGFNAEIDTYYSPEGEFKIWCPNRLKSYLDNNGTETWWWKCIAPSQSMAMKWLRKVHNICVVSFPVVTDDDGEAGCLWNYAILRKLEVLHNSECLYESSETACEAAIKYCLENLI